MLLVEGISRELASECSDARQNAHVNEENVCLLGHLRLLNAVFMLMIQPIEMLNTR